MVLGEYSLLLLGKDFPNILTRNYLFVGIPYFIIGVFIRKYQEKITNIQHIRQIVAYFGSGFFVTTLLEKFLLETVGLSGGREHYISTTFLAICLFIFAITCKTDKKNILSRIGRECSSLIYVLHPISMAALDLVFSKFGLEQIYQNYGPILVFFITTIEVMCINSIKKLRRFL